MTLQHLNRVHTIEVVATQLGRQGLRTIGLGLLVVGMLASASVLSHFSNTVASTAVGQEGVEDDELASPEFTDAQLEHFENKIRPLLIARCAECHGEDSSEPAGGLAILSRRLLLEGGDTGAAIEPGNPDESLLIQSVRYDGDYQMPPDSKIPDEELALLEAWVADGAPWPAHDDEVALTGSEEFDLAARRQQHWCWSPLAVALPPEVHDDSWPIDPIDHFVLAKLEEAGLRPSPDADKATWLRRVSFDLTGLPPTVAEWEAFRDDHSEQAYAKVVDRLLESPRFGERWARHWMDLVRYAETCGHEFDYPIPGASQYRDYLIRAFNSDVPYDQFVTEHLAGDLMPNPRRHPTAGYDESIIATGFWFLGEATHAPVDVKGDEAGRIDNQLDVMSKSFLGLTVACARCHDHKFDAISTKDYYALSGFLQSSRRWLAPLDLNGGIEKAQSDLRTVQRKAAEAMAESLRSDSVRNTLRSEVTTLMAALQSGEVRASDESDVDQLVIADFEEGAYSGWIAEGEAFGSVPQSQETLAAYQGDVGAAGKFFVNSHSRTGNDGSPSDAATGTLTSPEFEISRRFLHFLVGGGNHADRTCVQVVVDGQVVASQTGFANNRMQAVRVDLSNWTGKKAVIRIVDQESGGWGNIGADRFVLSHRESLSGDRPDWGRLVGDVLPEDRVSRWGTALSEAAQLPLSHPAGPLAQQAQQWLAKHDDSDWKARLQTWSQEVQGIEERQLNWLNQSISGMNYAADGQYDLFTMGQAFERRDDDVAWSFDGSWKPTSRTVVSSRSFGDRAHGELHSPEFTIESNKIWYLIKGSDVELRVVIDGYTMHIYNGLLFSDLTKRIDTQGEWRWIEQSGDLGRYLGHRAHFEILDHGHSGFELAEVRFSDVGPPAERLDAIASAAITEPTEDLDQWIQAQLDRWISALDACAAGTASRSQVELVGWLIKHQLLPLPQATQATLAAAGEELQRSAAAIPDPVLVQALADGSGEDEAVFIRGNHRLLGDVVPRRDLEALCENEWPETAGSGRLQLAEQIVSPDHPLTSRVMVNRMWHHLFGRGIVATVDNFGVLGEAPTHPELLDHLAVSFVDDKWSIKRMLKRMVLSRTYRQSSQPVAESVAIDPTNRLWHRMEVRRLQGEALRDSMLLISGRLNPEMFNGSVPVYLTDFMQGRGRPGGSGPLDGARRRSVYQEVRRNFLPPMMLAFDAPIPFSSVGRRNVSNVPAQALILLNDPFVHEQARHWAEHLIAAKSDPGERIEQAFLEAFTRKPSDAELQRAMAFVEAQAAALDVPAEQSSSHPQVWADLCHALWNVKSFSYLD